MHPFNKETLQAVMIAIAEHGKDPPPEKIQEIITWPDKKRAGAYKKLINSSPDISFVKPQKTTYPHETLKDCSELLEDRPDLLSGERIADESTFKNCENKAKEFLENTGFNDSFGEVVISTSFPCSFFKRSINPLSTTKSCTDET